MSARLQATQGPARIVWFLSGSLAMGFGVWSMHFIGMLALKMPFRLEYDVPMTLVSLLAAIGSSALALRLGARREASRRHIVAGGLVMGAGIASMHYLGMAALMIEPGVHYRPGLFVVSCLIAVGVSFAALWIMRRIQGVVVRRALWRRAGAAVLMGLAISGMHYTGMAAADFAPDTICTASAPTLSVNWLATAIGMTTMAVLGIAVLSAIVDAHMVSKAQQYNESLSRANVSLREANDELAWLASHDPLTGLPNRVMLMRLIDEAIAAGDSFAVIFVDLDRFKLINDSMGHHVGDQLLTQVAGRLASASTDSNHVVARLGGDEFVVLCRDIADSSRAVRRAHLLRTALRQGFDVNGKELHVTATLGISLYPTDGRNAEELLVNADAAMYHGKQSRRDSLRLFEPLMGTVAQQRMEIEDGLRHALKHGGLELHYQPKVSIGSGVVVGHEALVRWRCPKRGLVRPDVFIPIAEDAGLISDIGEWVLREACRQNRQWQAAGFEPMGVAVNISARQFRQTDLFEQVRSILDETGLAPRYLELELTESTFMVEPENTARVLQQMGDLGVQISIDDFGTGFSSLAYLRNLPLNKLKVDRAFVQGLADDPKDASIVEAIISMARSLKLAVIAEGVETPGQLQVLQHLGCDEYQGYLFSPPALPQDIEGFIPRADAVAGDSARPLATPA